MTGLEITLVIIGVIFLLGSFFVQDRLSNSDMKQIANVSEKEISMILDKQMQRASSEIEDKVDLAVEETYDATRRAIEKETKEKLTTISEYSDTVIESVNKAHNEIMFLYSMLNDKHKELTALASDISRFSEDMEKRESEMMERVSFAAEMGGTASGVSDRLRAVSEQPGVVDDLGDKPHMADLPKEKTESSSGRKTASKTAKAAKTTRTSKKAVSAETAKKSGKDGAETAAKSGRRSTRKTASVPEIPVSDELAQSNEDILKMHMQGLSEVEIAKALGRGLGEIRFVIGLYRGDVVK